MDKLTFEKLVSSPFDISSNEAGQLEGLLSSFPYCQAAYLLIAKESHDKKSMLYPQKLRKASTYSLNRKVLHHLIHKKSTIANPEKKNDLTVTNKTLVVESSVSVPVIAPTDQAVSKPDNSSLIKELEENMRLLRTQKHLYEENSEKTSEVQKTLQAVNQEGSTDNRTFLQVSQVDKNRSVNAFTSAPLVIEETKLGDELSSDHKQEGSELEILLSYLCPPSTEQAQSQVIDKFIRNEPKISKASVANLQTEHNDLSRQSTELKIELTTENYALILVKQNKIEKAKDVYRKLILKYPDKSAYFAAKIHELENR